MHQRCSAELAASRLGGLQRRLCAGGDHARLPRARRRLHLQTFRDWEMGERERQCRSVPVRLGGLRACADGGAPSYRPHAANAASEPAGSSLIL
jgi:hypothetical protein